VNELQIFKNEAFGEIRIVEVNGEPWFVGRDVALALGYQKPENAIAAHVHEDDKTTTLLQGTGSNYKSKAIVINESGMYALVFGSKLEEAKEFKHWVTSEVLPSIRKHGMYAIEDLINNPDLGIAALQALKTERERVKELQLTTAIQKQQISELQPKATYYDAVLQCKDAIPITIIAKDYGYSANKMNKLLHEYGVQYKQSGAWLLYQCHADMGYTASKTHHYSDSLGIERSVIHTYWTQKGRLFIYELLKSHGILPIMEQEVPSTYPIYDIPQYQPKGK
jgi:prophage antirepressor-like protein